MKDRQYNGQQKQKQTNKQATTTKKRHKKTQTTVNYTEKFTTDKYKPC